jgi:hypothetical protein
VTSRETAGRGIGTAVGFFVTYFLAVAWVGEVLATYPALVGALIGNYIGWAIARA